MKPTRKVILTASAPRPLGAYSQAIVADGLVFVSGQLCVNPRTNQLECGDIRSETRRVLENLRAILEAAGSSLEDVVRVGVYLADLSDFAGMNEVYQEFFPEDPPARATVGVASPGKCKVEIDCIARVRPRSRMKHRARSPR